jgi:hypothetical protein
MADYDQPDYVTRRPRYFNNQYLSEQDFIDEQRYHIDRRRRHDRLLHVSGIADGLDVTFNGAVVTVSAGTGVDELGRPLLLDTAQTLTLTSEHQGTRVVYARYQEVPSNEVVGDQGVKGYTRFNETSQLLHEAPGGATTDGRLVLAELTVGADGKVTALKTDRRKYTGLRLAGPAGKTLTLRASNDGTRAVLDTGLSLAEPLAVGTVSAAGAQLEVKAGAGRTPLRVTDADGKVLLVLGNDSSLALGAADRVGKLTLSAKGSLIELGAGISGKQVDAGKIGYQAWTDGLDIIGAGTGNTDRKVTLWAEGGTTFKGPLMLDNKAIYLRGPADTNQGLAWYGSNAPFTTRKVDGPFLFGWTGGALGTFEAPKTVAGGRATPGYENVALFWNKENRVGIGAVTSLTAQLEIQATTKETDALRVTDSAGTELLKLDASANIKLAGTTVAIQPSKYTSFGSPLYLGNKALYLRGAEDTNHGLAWYGGTTKFASLTPDGPVLFGNLGGGLGTRNGGDRVALSWSNDGAVKLASNTDADLFASGAPERVRMVRGSVHGNGNINTGTGFKVTRVKDTNGLYDITFDKAFAELPTVVVTQQYSGDNEKGGNTLDNAVVVFNKRGGVRIKTGKNTGDAEDRFFHFIVMGW